jgi:hypothetical protein
MSDLEQFEQILDEWFEEDGSDRGSLDDHDASDESHPGSG